MEGLTSMEMTIAGWAVEFDLVRSIQEAEELCYIGNLRLNGVSCSANAVPQAGDVLSSLNNGYQYQIPSFGTING